MFNLNHAVTVRRLFLTSVCLIVLTAVGCQTPGGVIGVDPLAGRMGAAVQTMMLHDQQAEPASRSTPRRSADVSETALVGTGDHAAGETLMLCGVAAR